MRSLLGIKTILLSNEVVTRYIFKSWKALWHLSVHSNAFFRTLKNGKHLSVVLETNLLRAATRPVRDWTSLILYGGFISRIALIFSGFALIPLCETMNPRNFLDATPKAHLLGFNFIPYCLSVLKVSCRSSRCFPSSRLFTNLRTEHLVDQSLVCCSSVFQAEGHYFITE